MDRAFDLGLMRLGAQISEPGAGGSRSVQLVVGELHIRASRVRVGGRHKTYTYRLSAELAQAEAAEVGPYRQSARESLAALEPVYITRETSALRRARAVGLSRDVSLDDPSFDGSCFVETTGPVASVRELLAHPDARRATLTLLERGADSVTVGARGERAVVVQLEGVLGPAVFAPGAFEAWVADLSCLVDNLPPVERIVHVYPKGRIALAVVLGTMAVFALFVLALGSYTRLGGLAQHEGALMAASVAVLVVWAWFAARHWPHAARSFGVFAVLSAGVGPLAVHAGHTLFNCALDQPKAELARIASLRYVEKNRAYKADVLIRGVRVSYNVEPQVWPALREGGFARVYVGEGALGVPWRTKRLLPADPRE